MRFHKLITPLSLTASLILTFAQYALGQVPPPPSPERRVTAVQVEIERGDYCTTDESLFLERSRAIRQTVLANIKTEPGKPFSESVLNEDVKRLTGLGQFHVDIRLQESESGVSVIFVIFPKFRIKEITLKLQDGSSPSGEAELSKALTSSVGAYFSDYFADYDAECLAAKHTEKGYPFARARYEKKSEKDSVNLTFIIDPGPYVRIREILFHGNKFFSSKELYPKMQSRVYTFLRNIFGDPTYNAKRLEQDIQIIREAYRDQGYLDVKVFLKETIFDFTDNMATPVIEIVEGDKYTVSSVAVSGVTLYKPEEILQKLSLKDGSPFIKDNFQKDLQTIRDLYGSSGRLLTTVEPRLSYDETGTGVHILYEIGESPKTYVGKIIIRGNNRTKEKVIRRELSIYPGEEFSIPEIRNSRDRLFNLGYFSSVDIQAAPGEGPDKGDLIITVQERRTGQLRLGFSVSSTFGLQGLFAITQPNFDLFDTPKSLEDLVSGNAFAGAGNYLALELMPGREATRYRLFYRDPHIFDSDYRFSLGLNYSDTTYERWREQKEYISIGLGENLTRDLILDILYRIQDTVISHILSYAPADVFEWEGPSTLSALKAVLSYNKSQADQFGTRYKGYTLQGSYEYAGGFLGADVDFSSASLSAFLYKSVMETRTGHKHVLSLEASAAWMEEHHNSKDIPIYERLFAGGPGTIRGFEWRGIGPHEYISPLGGTVRAYANLEYSFPLPIEEEVFRALLFLDTANLASDIESFRTDEFRVAAGFGLRIKPMPSFVISLSFGYPLRYEPEDQRRTFNFTLGAEW